MSLRSITWSCHICKTNRPDNKIDVKTTDLSSELKLPYGTIKQNVRYCNDNKDCKTKAQTYRFGKKVK
tara:strand:- start:308 stop:511 length:204 start_codon:yes stop_codon:yes gene_type:complete